MHTLTQPHAHTSTHTGVQIFTGMNLIEAIGIGAYYGAGMEFTTGAGVTVFTGCNLMDFNGILSQVKHTHTHTP
eukprot:48242-Eustigmatos_ZCMA.PRE.1